jgi:hypothetical protein
VFFLHEYFQADHSSPAPSPSNKVKPESRPQPLASASSSKRQGEGAISTLSKSGSSRPKRKQLEILQNLGLAPPSSVLERDLNLKSQNVRWASCLTAEDEIADVKAKKSKQVKKPKLESPPPEFKAK